MSNFSNGLSPEEAERLALLLEEMGESLQCVGKILRHGMRSKHPREYEEGRDNRESLERELGQVLYAIDLMVANGDISPGIMLEYRKRKAQDVVKFLHHQTKFPPME